MSYIKKTLLPDEQLSYYSGPHAIVFFPCVIWLVVTVATAIFLSPEYIFISYIGMMMVIFYAIACYISYISREYGITNKRVLVKMGFIRRHSLEIFFHKIESINTRQSVFGRMFDYGTVIISGTGGSQDPFDFVPHPLEFRRCVQEQMEHLIISSEEKQRKSSSMPDFD